jgi:hypothetical protein
LRGHAQEPVSAASAEEMGRTQADAIMERLFEDEVGGMLKKNNLQDKIKAI